MKKILSILLFSLIPAGVSGQLTVPSCTTSEAIFLSSLNTATSCLGWTVGNDSETVVTNWLTDWGFIETFKDDTERSFSESITFDNPFSNFVLAFKAGDYYALYYFEGYATGVDFNLPELPSGQSDNDGFKNLSHYTVYTTSVPEPSSMFLLATGFIGLIGVRNRNKLV